ncbi:MAG: tRNA pseudouridine(13) synthase TruD, partial [Candidatus Thermoplasmatota archaeon]|nr:tRNA pseudouridine(13) synthase TruD [Candidatus Thermoplasmatota archaeon]
FAGTKDKRAITSQVMSFSKVSAEHINQLDIQDVECNILHYSNKQLSIGDLIGNSFMIVIREVPSDKKRLDIDHILGPLKAINGFPNFFGVQRFGGIRPITHHVGKAMVSADFKKAVMIYLCQHSDFEGDDATISRKKLRKTKDFKEGFHHFPRRLRFEKILMQHLTNHPEDYAGALQQLPKNLLTMLVYAHQSYLFNRMLSNRISSGLSLTEAVEGDIILPVMQEGVVIDPIPVTTMNLNKVNQQIKKGKAVVSCIIPGSETTFADGEMGEIQQKVIEDEKVDIRDFIIPEIPVASSYGTHRPILANMNNLTVSINQDEFHQGKQKISLSFSLFKGSYATSFLREIMKLKDITKY